MRRLFWITVGATVGVYAVRKATQAAQAYTPAGLSSSLSDLGDGLRDLADAVREGMAEREEELRAALGIDTGATDATTSGDARRLDVDRARALLDDPTGPRAR